jgi:hypothetical protein
MNLARQAEDQRVSMTNFLVTIAAAILAFIVQRGFGAETLLLSLFVSLLGLFGLLSSVKFTQHYHRHYTEAKFIRQRLNELCPEGMIENISYRAAESNQKHYPTLGRKIRIVILWTFLHGSIFVIGIGCMILILL